MVRPLFRADNRFSGLSHFRNRDTMKICSCILAKNNENSLGRAIDSVQNHVDEVIVVDTGSNDSTVQVAENLGAKVHFASWSDDFSYARNVSLEFAKDADWVLIIDSDEEFVWEGTISLREWIKQYTPAKDVIAFECSHIETNHCEEILSITHVERLFSPSFFCYEGPIHERIVSTQKNTKLIRLCQCASFRHYGYSSEFHTQKNLRNINLLIKAIESNPTDAINYRYMSTETFNAEKYIESIEHANTALNLLPLNEKYSRSQAYYYKIMSYLFLRNTFEAELTIKACIEELPAYSDPYGIAGEIQFSKKEWRKALAFFEIWEDQLKEKTVLLPKHCVSLKHTFQEHKRIAAIKIAGNFDSLIRREAQSMKLGILIINPHLEYDWKELLKHIQGEFGVVSYEIGVWKNTNISESMNDFKTLWKQNNVRMVQGLDIDEAKSKFAEACKANIIWVWEANERVISEIDNNLLLKVIAHRGEVTIQSYSERLGAEWNEQRITINKFQSIKADYSSFLEATINETKDYAVSNNLIVKKSFIIPIEKQSLFFETYSNESTFKQLLVAFACQKYADVLKIVDPSSEDSKWTTYQFYKILSCINLGLIDQASEIIYDVLDSEIDNEYMLDFVYLYGKLSQNVVIEDMKKDAIELLNSTIASNSFIETKHVLTTESHWLTLIAELQWQLGERENAILSWRHGLEISSFTNEDCAYRLAEAIYEEYINEGHDKVARKIIETLHDSSEGYTLIYPIFMYLNMPEWALLFQVTQELKNIDTVDINNMPLVSIILPVFNDIKYLCDSIRSILSQTYINLELIIVDNGSEENIKIIANRFKYDSRVKFYRTKSNTGLPNALNYGISKAKGSIMGWTSADNYAHPRWLERMIFKLEENPRAVAVYSDYYHINEDGIVIETKRIPAYKLNGLQNGGPSLLWRSFVLGKSGNFDESLFGIEDRDFTIRLALTGRIISLPEPLYYYRIHEQSLSSKIDLGSLGGWPMLHEKLKAKWLYLSFV